MSERPMPKQQAKISPGVWIVIACGVASLLMIAVALAIKFGSGSSGPAKMSAEEVRKAKPVATMNAPKLWGEFGSNRLGAEEKFFGNVVELEGTIAEVSSNDDGDFLGFSVMASRGLTPAEYAAKSPLEKKWFNEGYPSQVVCYLADGERSRAAKLKKNARVRIRAVPCEVVQDSQVPNGYKIICNSAVILD